MDLNAKLTPYRLWYCLLYTFSYSILWYAVLVGTEFTYCLLWGTLDFIYLRLLQNFILKTSWKHHKN